MLATGHIIFPRLVCFTGEVTMGEVRTHDVQRRTRRTQVFSAVSAVSAVSALIVSATLGVGAQRRDFPTRPPGDPAAIERGKALYGVNCTFCHGADTRGGDGGPSLLRAATVLDDQRGELIAPVVKSGR